MGDPAGIGPEIVVKALTNKSLHDIAKMVVIGDKDILIQAMKFCDIGLSINLIENVQDGDYKEGVMNLIDLDNVDIENLKMGEVQGMAGRAAYEYIAKSIQLAMSKEVEAIATTPINKEAFKAGNVGYIGHTEVFEDLTKTKDPLTMFQVHDLKVFFLSRHLSLKQACEFTKKDKVYECIVRCTEALKRLGIEKPKLAVAGLNPHCGEHGLFGREEVDEIEPAVQEARDKNYNVEGPISADSVFHFALKGRYDAVISLYHDQGHIATKMVDFERTISLTNNMPFLRTSVDHGTAFNIAGQGIASEVSMVEAVRLAAFYAKNF
jgi:4-hydroxythreonine-4-phosphate dehydrogenase